jgi:hypothetical protein
VPTELERRLAIGDVPESLRDVLMPFPWDLANLLSLDLAVGTIKVSDYLWMLDLPLWREGERLFAVTPNEVRRHPSDHPEQWKRTLAADMTAPIHITERDERMVVLDGVHRVLRCVVDGRSTLPARIVPMDRWGELAVESAATRGLPGVASN